MNERKETMNRRAVVHQDSRPYTRAHHTGDLAARFAPIPIPWKPDPSGEMDWDNLQMVKDIREHHKRYPFTTTYIQTSELGATTEIPHLVDLECEHGRLAGDGGEPCGCHATRRAA